MIPTSQTMYHRARKGKPKGKRHGKKRVMPDCDLVVVVGSGFAGSTAPLSLLEVTEKAGHVGRVALIEAGKLGTWPGGSRWSRPFLRLGLRPPLSAVGFSAESFAKRSNLFANRSNFRLEAPRRHHLTRPTPNRAPFSKAPKPLTRITSGWLATGSASTTLS